MSTFQYSRTAFEQASRALAGTRVPLVALYCALIELELAIKQRLSVDGRDYSFSHNIFQYLKSNGNQCLNDPGIDIGIKNTTAEWLAVVSVLVDCLRGFCYIDKHKRGIALGLSSAYPNMRYLHHHTDSQIGAPTRGGTNDEQLEVALYLTRKLRQKLQGTGLT